MEREKNGRDWNSINPDRTILLYTIARMCHHQSRDIKLISQPHTPPPSPKSVYRAESDFGLKERVFLGVLDKFKKPSSLGILFKGF